MTYVQRVCDIVLGEDSHFDAWLYSMLMDNNIAYNLNPHLIASQEQLRFMVHLSDRALYLPCSDKIFHLIHDSKNHPDLQKQYNRAWRISMRLLRNAIPDQKTRKRVLQFCRYRFHQSIAQKTLIPQRLVKRMTDLIIRQGFDGDDPWEEKKRLCTKKHRDLFSSPVIAQALDHIDVVCGTSMIKIRQELNRLELVRLFSLCLMARSWENTPPTKEDIEKTFAQAETEALPIFPYLPSPGGKSLTILYHADADGSPFFDLTAISALIRMGHRVIYAVKAGFHFCAPTIADILEDPVLEEAVRHAKVLPDRAISKNDLLRELHAHTLVIINDGTRERINLYRVSVTFARAWKEADLIVCRGWRSHDVLFGTSHEFTRPILCFWLDEEKKFRIAYRPKAVQARKFSAEDIRAYADSIIKNMREAHRKGLSVMFFSCIIGSIPGQTKFAIELAKTFVADLREKLDNVLIINPAEHFIEGMDGDDLMYMWERVQRSGQIDVWRFQTTEDVERSFALLGKKVPHIWSGKDATYSTGCTKEMRIALEVQQKNHEMQIIGPDPKLFFRRGEYGVGKYFDAKMA